MKIRVTGKLMTLKVESKGAVVVLDGRQSEQLCLLI